MSQTLHQPEVSTLINFIKKNKKNNIDFSNPLITKEGNLILFVEEESIPNDPKDPIKISLDELMDKLSKEEYSLIKRRDGKIYNLVIYGIIDNQGLWHPTTEERNLIENERKENDLRRNETKKLEDILRVYTNNSPYSFHEEDDRYGDVDRVYRFDTENVGIFDLWKVLKEKGYDTSLRSSDRYYLVIKGHKINGFWYPIIKKGKTYYFY